jgi:hypothetical protein
VSPEQRLAIEAECTRLINHYANLNDQARWEEAVALYAEDGLMTRPTAPDAPIVGREALLAAFLARPARTSQHVCSNIVVTVESETEASAFSVILLFTAKDQPPLVGSYRDRFALTGEGWRFAERRGALTFPAG